MSQLFLSRLLGMAVILDRTPHLIAGREEISGGWGFLGQLRQMSAHIEQLARDDLDEALFALCAILAPEPSRSLNIVQPAELPTLELPEGLNPPVGRCHCGIAEGKF